MIKMTKRGGEGSADRGPRPASTRRWQRMCPDNATEKGSPGLADVNAAVTGDLGHDVPAAGGNGVLRWEGGKPGAEAGPACGDTSVPCVFLWASGAFGTSEARTQTHWLLPLHPREMFLSKSIKLIRESHGEEGRSARTSLI